MLRSHTFVVKNLREISQGQINTRAHAHFLPTSNKMEAQSGDKCPDPGSVSRGAPQRVVSSCVWGVCVSTVVHALESEMVTTSWQLPHHCLMSAGQHSDTLLAYYVSTLFTPETRGAEKPGNHCIPSNFCVCHM